MRLLVGLIISSFTNRRYKFRNGNGTLREIIITQPPSEPRFEPTTDKRSYYEAAMLPFRHRSPHLKKSLPLWLPELFLYAQFRCFLLKKQPFCDKIYIIFPAKHENSKRQFYTFLIDPLKTQNKNPFQKKFATLAARAVFVCAISLLFALKQPFFDKSYIIFPAVHGNSKC